MSRLITLINDDHDTFKVLENNINISVFVYNYINETDEEEPVLSIGKIKKNVMDDILKFCNYYVTDKMNEIPKPLLEDDLGRVIQPFYCSFINKDNQDDIFQLILASNFLQIKPLLELGCAKIASLLKNKEPDEIQKMFNISNNYTHDENKVWSREL